MRAVPYQNAHIATFILQHRFYCLANDEEFKLVVVRVATFLPISSYRINDS